jgi:hypothetical protein
MENDVLTSFSPSSVVCVRAGAYTLLASRRYCFTAKYEFDSSSQENTSITTFLTAGTQVLMDVSIAGATTRVKTVIVRRRLKISSWSQSIAFSCLGLAVFCLNLLAPFWFRLNQSGIGPYASDQDITRYISCPICCEGERERERKIGGRLKPLRPSHVINQRDWRMVDPCYLSYSSGLRTHTATTVLLSSCIPDMAI